MGDLSVFDFFRQETSHSDIVVRTEAMSKIMFVIVLMEPDKVRSDMIPYLQSKNKEEDQVLLALASRIGNFTKYLGGAEYVHLLIPIFEFLCETEETTVRTATTTSLNKILSQLNMNIHKTQIQEYLELFKRLLSNEENVDAFYGSISCCYMLGQLYRLTEGNDHATIREIYNKLVVDEVSLVKRAASINLISLATHVEADILSGDLFQIFKKMLVDDLATVRVIATESFIAYIKLLKASGNIRLVTSDLLPMIHSCYEDPSWKIRLSISKEYESLSECFDPSIITTDIFPGLLLLLTDIEPDIRRNSVKALQGFVSVLGITNFLNEFIPLIPTLLNDPMSDVRKTLAETCVDIAIKLSPDQVNTHMTDIILKIMADEDPLVRLRIIQKIPIIAVEMPSLCTKLSDNLKNCLVDVNWRVRKGIILVLPALVKVMGIDYFTEYFLSLFLNVLKDSVGEVRLASAEVVPLMISYIPPGSNQNNNNNGGNNNNNADFVYNHIFPTVKSMGGDEYVVRLNMLTVLDGLIRIRDLNENFRTEVVQLLVNASNDKVANIRLRAAQVMASVGTCAYPENVKGYIKLILSNMQNDKDKDVQYFTSLALKEFQ